MSVSPAVQNEVARVDEQGTGDTSTDVSNPAGSSSAERADAETPGSMLDAVKAALATPAEASSTSTEGSPEGSQGGAPADAAKDAAEVEDITEQTDLSRYHSKTREQIQRLLAQRKQAQARVMELEPKAEQFDRILGFVEQAGLSIDEVNTGFEIMRLIKHEPGKALAALLPYVQSLQRLTGDLLPDDLREQVEMGRIDETVARELAQHRSRAVLAREQAQRAAEIAERRRVEEAAAAQRRVASAVSEWDAAWSRADPDYKAKLPRVQEKIELALLKMRSEGRELRDPREAVALADRARAEVNAEFARFKPQPKEVRPVVGGGAASGTPVPQTALEAARAALRR